MLNMEINTIPVRREYEKIEEVFLGLFFYTHLIKKLID